MHVLEADIVASLSGGQTAVNCDEQPTRESVSLSPPSLSMGLIVICRVTVCRHISIVLASGIHPGGRNWGLRLLLASW